MSAVAEVVSKLVDEVLDMLGKGEAGPHCVRMAPTDHCLLIVVSPGVGADVCLGVGWPALDVSGAAEAHHPEAERFAVVFGTVTRQCQGTPFTQYHRKKLRKSILDLANRFHGARSSWGVGRPLEMWCKQQPWRDLADASFGLVDTLPLCEKMFAFFVQRVLVPTEGPLRTPFKKCPSLNLALSPAGV